MTAAAHGRLRHGFKGQIECGVDALGVAERCLEDVAQVLVLHHNSALAATTGAHHTAATSSEMYASVSRSLTDVGSSTEHTNDTACPAA